MSKGLLAIPLWVPQSAMGLGLLILTIALVDEFIGILRGQTPSYVENSTALFSGEDD